MPDKIAPGTVYAIDVETSGLNPAGDRVIEYGAVKIQRGEISAEATTLIDVPCCIHPQAQRTHGIDATMLVGQPGPEAAWREFLEFIGKAPLIAHNAPFDIRFISAELSRLGIGLLNKSICTLRLTRRRYPRLNNHKLETVARHVLGEIPADCHRHRALGDARLVARLWLALEGK
ncbi:MAG: 3'-5' exonuclease [Candidatus Neomarinimicrobiota bacterium]